MLVPIVLATHEHAFSIAFQILGALLAFGLAGAGTLAFRRSRNVGLWLVVAAFLVFASKGLFTAWALWSEAIAHEDLEDILTGFDFVILLLLVAPFLSRRLARNGARP